MVLINSIGLNGVRRRVGGGCNHAVGILRAGCQK